MSNASPTAPPPAAPQYSVDWNNVALQAITLGLDEVPVIGSILSHLLAALWPGKSQDVWGEIRQNVEQLVNQAITEDDYNQVQADLGAVTDGTGSGLAGDLNNYVCSLDPNASNYNGMEPTMTWNAAEGAFTTAQPHFQPKGSELVFLPLFAQFANMHLSLLRDGVIKGYVNEATLKTKLDEYGTYVDTQYKLGHDQRAGANKGFNYLNEYVSGMQVSVLRFRETWPYFDPTKFPPPVKVAFTDQTYFTISSQLNYPGGDYQLPGSLPLTPLTNVDVYWLQDSYDNYNLVVGTQTSYGAAQEPYSGVNDAVPPVEQPCNDGDDFCYFKQSVAVSPGNPVVAVSGVYDNAGGTYCVEFTFQDGSSTGQLPSQGGSTTSGYTTPFNIAPPKGFYLSSVWAPSDVGYYQSAADLVFGFRYTAPALDEATARALYVSSVRPVAGDPRFAPFAGAAQAQDWEGQRQQFLARMKAAASS